ncbi:diiron oxygenase [Pseudomonas benzenivorans]|uniref:Diiron oxygenase n=1 Tax=Pseudomonas benzenivorans TaxID=556533 RepID=A0ABY5H281_9PSED|nr:diiron oxygenase [Pseudomonas benzenivorans]UTW06391.1 diiron oxygenase [Pseudomonas benzenivorans]
MNAVVELSSSQFFESVNKWYATATVKNSPRIVIAEAAKDDFTYPKSRQILGDHPKVQALGRAGVGYVLAQSAYQYMYEIGLLETRFVIDCSLNIVNNVIAGASEEEKLNALTVVIDEGYHAHVALDYIIQMKNLTGIEPLEVPQTNGNLSAVRRAFDQLPREVHSDFQLISVTLAEHTLTKDLISIGREKEASQAFTKVMTDHVSDEGRHASYFANLMKAHWARLPEQTRCVIGAMLPAYLDDYLAGDETRAFDGKILQGCGFSAVEADSIIADTQAQYLDNLNGYIGTTKANLVKLLQRCGVLDHQPTRAAFIQHGVAL